MDQFKLAAPGEGLVLNIVAELEYWAGVVAGADVGVPFDHVVPTIKFAYDQYLLHHEAGLLNLLPDLQEKYRLSVEAARQLDGQLVETIVRHAWRRMSAG
ncbi:hypothetical protein J2X02_000930 [Pseudoxanthomonas japonensis]|uniref:hypothetical protein n=1 Tax=Pseudoxanthomonas japonensis TaxID=69284 RepID=UPI002864724A|nr:hypothetical protein [Pseudoxanthomonas japonensis]MDR7068113.1 hypothetical protein [Pseudoxanthomonas japonensis]